ncbi:MAG: stage II sporulation protein R [Clostridia bacterium]|nr:stage II sporulation protein R [Clostridia bacterium]
MKNKNRSRAVAFALTLTAAVMITLVSAAFVPIEESKLYRSVIRLRVIANSDDEADQSLKLAVRDAILSGSHGLFAGDDIDEAVRIVGASEPELLAIAGRVLAEYSADYGARVVFGEEEYPTREYDGRIFPAGRYLSLRVILGKGEGQNWWCVLFPPLCLGGSHTGGDGDSSESERYAEPTNRTRIRIKLLEWFGFY